MKTVVETIQSINAGQSFSLGDDLLILANAIYTPIEVKLPPADALRSGSLRVIKIDATSNAVSIVASDGATVYGTASVTSQFSVIDIDSDLKNRYFVV
jgi:hypothetical protein